MRLLSIALVFAAFTGVLPNPLLSNCSRIHVRVVTWSVEKKHLPHDLLDLVLLKERSQSMGPDIIAVGLQNLGYFDDEKDNWIKTLKESASGYHTIDVRVSKGNALITLAKVTIPSTFYRTLHTRDVSFKLFSKNGGIITHFNLFNSQFTFVCLRLSKKNDVQKRIEQYRATKKNMKENNDPKSDYTFWLGNWNFKVDLEPHTAKPLVEGKNWTTLLLHDQLKKAQKSRKAFVDLKELTINFRPTYKFKSSIKDYDWSVTPSWADRILFSSKKDLTITPVKYELIERYKKSEHKPVLADFIVKINCKSRGSTYQKYTKYPSYQFSTTTPEPFY